MCPCVSPHLCICTTESKRGGWRREAFVSIYLHKPPIGFFQQLPLHHELRWIVFQSPGCERRISGLKFFLVMCENDKEKRKAACQRFCIYICMCDFGNAIHTCDGAVCMVTRAVEQMRMNSFLSISQSHNLWSKSKQIGNITTKNRKKTLEPPIIYIYFHTSNFKRFDYKRNVCKTLKQAYILNSDQLWNSQSADFSSTLQ